jgi:TetR/AcrR family transcriptional repressor of bet genes
VAIRKKQNSLVRTEQKQITRQKLIEATMDIIGSDGFSGVKMAKVAEQAGFSRGIGNFHFQSKEQLLLETLRACYFEFDAAWKKAIADAGQLPANQITSVIKTVLLPPIGDPKKTAIWLAFWGETSSRKTYLDICAVHDREWDKAMEDILAKMVDDDFISHGMTLAAITRSLSAIMGGFWVDSLLSADTYRADDGISACLAFVKSFIPKFETP